MEGEGRRGGRAAALLFTIKETMVLACATLLAAAATSLALSLETANF